MSTIQKEGSKIEILKETEDWVVVAKPPSLLTHGHPRFPNEYTLIERIQDQEGGPVWIVHRLDRGASGCLLLSKKREQVPMLKEALQKGEKRYIALVRGFFDYEGIITIEKPMKVNGKIKEACSVVQCLGRCHEPRSSLLLVRPKTGRYHQVRRHVRDLHHPVLSDSEHGDSHLNRWWRENMGLKRLGLHALSMSLSLSNGTEICVNSPLFLDQYTLFRTLPWWDSARQKEPLLEEPPLTSPI